MDMGLLESTTQLDAKLSAQLKGRVLLVDGMPDMLKITARLLRSMGLQITTANNGLEAVKIALLAQKAGYGFDLILMNVQLPLIDGITATLMLRSQGLQAPIIAVSEIDDDSLEQQCLDAGCNRFVLNSTDFDPIFNSVRMHLPALAS